MADSTSKILKARKYHCCIWCKRNIIIGTQYVRVRSVEGNRHYSDTYHTECFDALRSLPHCDQDEWFEEHCPEMQRGHNHEIGYDNTPGCPGCYPGKAEK
jgi:hypothetical protein